MSLELVKVMSHSDKRVQTAFPYCTCKDEWQGIAAKVRNLKALMVAIN